MTDQSAPTEIGIAEAANRMAALMGDGAPVQPKEQPAEAAAAEVDQTEATTDESSETPTGEDEGLPIEAASEDEGELPPETDVEDTTQEAPDLDALVTVKIDGKVEQITLKEALEGYQRTADYTRKTQAVQKERAEVEAIRQSAEAERAEYARNLAAVQQTLSQLMPQEPDWEKLHREDPLNFPLIEKQWRDYKAQLQFAQQEQARLQARQAQEAQAQLRKVVEEDHKVLIEKVPEWKDPAKWDQAKKQLRDYGIKLGYTQEQLDQVYHARDVLVLEKARRYDALMANRPKPQAGPANAPKPLRAGSTASSPKQATEVARMKQRLKATGSVDDAAKLFGLIDSRRR